MEAPKCSFCGKREWRHVCAQLPGVLKKAKVAPVVPDVAVAKSEGKKGKFDRVAYQRQLMRERRAREKALRAAKLKGD